MINNIFAFFIIITHRFFIAAKIVFNIELKDQITTKHEIWSFTVDYYQKSNILLYLDEYKLISYIWSWFNINYLHLQMENLFDALDTRLKRSDLKKKKTDILLTIPW